jgi:predicted ferric reductase
MVMGVLVGATWVLDLRLLGISRNIPLSAFRWVFRAVAVALTVNVVTGVLLFMQRATTLGTALPFFVKMFMVIASVATLVPIRSYVLRSDPDEREVRGSARLLAIVSILAWAGAITAGRLLAYLVP